jgi:hypothetical protein
MLERLKKALFRVPALQEAWSRIRARDFERTYASRRDEYARRAEERGLVYQEADVVAAVRDRLARRGAAPRRRKPGEVHTFTFVPRISWHASLLPDLRELGPVTEFDYAALGYDWFEFYRQDARAARRRREMNSRALAALQDAHARRRVDWMFVYASGLEAHVDFLRAVTEEIGIPVVNMCLDDKQSWTGPMLDGQRPGQVDIGPAFDLSWTSARVACEWYLVEGARPIYLPEGFDASLFRPLDVARDIPASFIGGAYGFRPAVVRYLRRRGIPLQVFGDGWNTRSLTPEEQVGVINRSAVNLGMGGVVHSETITNLKGRDFEIPGAGGGVYLTSFNPDLARHFDVGREILCYRNREEMVELIRQALKHPEESREIARRARERSLREHRWLHRYRRVLEILGILDDELRAPAAGRRPAAESGRPS